MTACIGDTYTPRKFFFTRVLNNAWPVRPQDHKWVENPARLTMYLEHDFLDHMTTVLKGQGEAQNTMNLCQNCYHRTHRIRSTWWFQSQIQRRKRNAKMQLLRIYFDALRCITMHFNEDLCRKKVKQWRLQIRKSNEKIQFFTMHYDALRCITMHCDIVVK